ncbi:MAG: hypothetical protein KBT70_14745 [Roseovarius sp.]|uniref:hypothetical protein n=1 Tax=Roseovarius sp. TaxID=1486281 RepID=UPI001B73E05A|nr:hypothetical protein [Roseovarius sp.]MBQ0751450.1 hypothetical protein [Roseovarius sp.]MBQ0809555.1 hypothetical protein [Roseovarius sp.]
MAFVSNPALRRILLIDAATCAVMAAILLVANRVLATLTGLPDLLVLGAGLVLVPVAIFMAAVARFGTGSGALVWLAILGNAGWVIASLGILVALTPTPLGIAFVLVQAAVVAVLAWLEASAWAGSARAAA